MAKTAMLNNRLNVLRSEEKQKLPTGCADWIHFCCCTFGFIWSCRCRYLCTGDLGLLRKPDECFKRLCQLLFDETFAAPWITHFASNFHSKSFVLISMLYLSHMHHPFKTKACSLKFLLVLGGCLPVEMLCAVDSKQLLHFFRWNLHSPDDWCTRINFYII